MFVTSAFARDRAKQAGFTLIELLVALSVLGMAVSVYISMYSGSLEIGESARNRAMALSMAEGQVHDICLRPNVYLWEIPEDFGLDKISVKLAEDDPKAGNYYPAYSSTPVDKRAHNLHQRNYERFRWHAFAQLPYLDSPHVNVTVVTTWKEGAYKRAIAISSAIPRSQVEGLNP